MDRRQPAYCYCPLLPCKGKFVWLWSAALLEHRTMRIKTLSPEVLTVLSCPGIPSPPASGSTISTECSPCRTVDANRRLRACISCCPCSLRISQRRPRAPHAARRAFITGHARSSATRAAPSRRDVISRLTTSPGPALRSFHVGL